MYVKDLMTPNAISAAPDDSIHDAREKLRRHRIHHLLVVEDNRILGVLSYRDLIGRRDADSVRNAMSRDVVVARPHETLREVAARLLGRTHGCAAVVEAGALVGVITTTDLLRAVSRQEPRIISA